MQFSPKFVDIMHLFLITGKSPALLMILIPVSSSQHEAKRKYNTGTTIVSTRSLPLRYPPPYVKADPSGGSLPANAWYPSQVLGSRFEVPTVLQDYVLYLRLQQRILTWRSRPAKGYIMRRCAVPRVDLRT